MKLYKGKNWDVIFGDWCQEFVGYCIIGNDKESLSELKLFGKVYKDKHFGYNFWKWALSKFKCQKDIFTKEERLKIY